MWGMWRLERAGYLQLQLGLIHADSHPGHVSSCLMPRKHLGCLWMFENVCPWHGDMETWGHGDMGTWGVGKRHLSTCGPGAPRHLGLTSASRDVETNDQHVLGLCEDLHYCVHTFNGIHIPFLFLWSKLFSASCRNILPWDGHVDLSTSILQRTYII